MRFCLSVILPVVLLLGGAALANAQQVIYEQPPAGVQVYGAVPSGEVRLSDGREILFGRVDKYKPGDKLEIALDYGGKRKFDLHDRDVLATLPLNLRKGDRVALDTYERGDMTFVTVMPRGEAYVRTDEVYGPGYTVTGRVKKLDPGRELEVELPNGKDMKFDLNDRDLTANIPTAIHEGDAVDITMSRSGRHEFVTIVPRGAVATVVVPPGVPGVAARTGTYIGRVQEYDPGDELQIVLDDGSNIDFDLDAPNIYTRISPGVATDSTVRVTVSDQLGNRYITVEPYPSGY